MERVRETEDQRESGRRDSRWRGARELEAERVRLLGTWRESQIGRENHRDRKMERVGVGGRGSK